MNKLCCLIIFVSLLITDAYCQTIINGDFETNTASTCQWNLVNPTYNNFMSNSWGFGNNGSSGLDIQKSSCGYANSPSNVWFVSIAWTPGWGTDALSLKIDSNLIAGNTYQIGYYDYGSNYNGPFVTPLIIGLSLDSLTFGDTIYSSLPSLASWTLKTFSFIAPNNGKYLTVKDDTTSGQNLAWNFVDDFHFLSSTGITNAFAPIPIIVSPTLFSNEININLQSDEFSEIIIYDITARKLIQQKFANSVTLNTEQLPKGIYLYEVRNKNRVVKKGKVVKD